MNNLNKKVQSKVDVIGNNILDKEKRVGGIGEELTQKIASGKEKLKDTIKGASGKIPLNDMFKEKFVKGLKATLNFSKIAGKATLKYSIKHPVKAMVAGVVITSMGGNLIHSFDTNMGTQLAQLNNQTTIENPIQEIKTANIIKSLAADENVLNKKSDDSKYSYSLFKNNDGTYTFLGYGANVNQKDEIKILVSKEGIDPSIVKIERAYSDEDIYKKNLELTSKNPVKMKEFLSHLKKGGDSKDRDSNFYTIYKYNISKDLIKEYQSEVNEINEFGNIEINEK